MNYSLADIENLDFRAACPPMPEDLKQEIMAMVRSFQEEKKAPVTAPRRFALIFALLILLTASAAYAAGKLGWADYLLQAFGIHVTEQTQQTLDSTAPRSFSVGPVTFEMNELFSDGRIVLAAAQAQTADGKGIFADDPTPDTLPKDEPWYMVRFLLEIPPEYRGDGEEMEDFMLAGSALTYLDLLPISVDPDIREIPATAVMTVREIDPETHETVNSWHLEESIVLPVDHSLETLNYLPEEPASLHGMRLLNVEAEKTAAGVYLTLQFEASENAEPQDTEYIEFSWLDENGNAYDAGVGVSMTVDRSQWPLVTVTDMITTDQLPEEITIQDNQTQEIVRLEAAYGG